MKRFLIWTSVVILALIGVAVRAVLTPPVAESPVGDAIIVHDGGHGERLSSALALAANQAAPVVVVMNGEVIDWPNGLSMCGQAEPFAVICPEPQPSNTIGEAASIAELLEVQPTWRRLVIVTSDYHLRRALMLDERCAAGATLLGVGAPTDIGPVRHTLLVIREVAALPHAWLSGCR